MAQQHKVGTHCTTVSHNPLRVTYHSTVLVEEIVKGGAPSPLRYRLDSGGYRTATTKTRINQAANEYGLGFRVFQDKGAWYVNTLGIDNGQRFASFDNVIPFVDGMMI